MNQRNRLPIVAVLILSIVAAGFARHWAAVARSSGAPGTALAGGGAGLSRMNSFALALLLGGLRGPLVMFLWPSAETQKQEKNLEDFDTKIELIRLLQAEFDTVHIFQIWNKAYNVSVQMANVGNKYRTILDALDYAHSVDAERPNNINILSAIGQIYFDKFGNSNEAPYYRERVREETQARQDMVRVSVPPARQEELMNAALDAGLSPRRLRINPDDKTGEMYAIVPKSIAEALKSKLTGPDVKFVDRAKTRINKDDPTWRRTELDPLLDAQGNLLPEYITPKTTKPSWIPADSEWNDDSELQYLKKYQPYPYGVSPWALGYAYYKRAQVLQSVYNQKHAQLGEIVVDSRPALSLKNWAEEERTRALRTEIESFGKPVPTDRVPMEGVTASIGLDEKILHRPPIDEAIFEYGRAAQLAEDAIAEYQRHLRNDTVNLTTYASHMDDLRGLGALAAGDRDYLLAMVSSGPQREQFRKSAIENYRAAMKLYQLNVLTYTTDDEMAKLFPPGTSKADIAQKNLSDEQVNKLFQQVRAAMPADLAYYQAGDEVKEYDGYINRAKHRLEQLGASGAS